MPHGVQQMTRGGNAKNWVAWWAIWSLGCTIALGDVVRTVQVPAPGEVRVELSWQLDFAPDACLIIRETWPEGWRLKELPAGAEDMAQKKGKDDMAKCVTRNGHGVCNSLVLLIGRPKASVLF